MQHRTPTLKHTTSIHTPQKPKSPLKKKMCFVEVFNHSGIKPQRVNGRRHPQTRGCLHTPKEGEKVLMHEKAGKWPWIPQWKCKWAVQCEDSHLWWKDSPMTSRASLSVLSPAIWTCVLLLRLSCTTAQENCIVSHSLYFSIAHFSRETSEIQLEYTFMTLCSQSTPALLLSAPSSATVTDASCHVQLLGG